MNPEVNCTAFAGIDWGDSSHQVCVLDSEGTVLGEKAFAHSGEGLRDMITWLLACVSCISAQVAVAIERPHGAVVDTLLNRGFQVGAINPKQSDRFRDRFSPAGAKDDRRDARVLASAIRTDPHCFRMLSPLPAEQVTLRECSRMTEDLTEQRTKLTNQIRQRLHEYFPQFLELGGMLYTLWLLELWKLIPTPERAKRVRLRTVATLMKKHRIRRLTPEQVLQILRSPSVYVAPGVLDASVRNIQRLCALLHVVNEQLREAKRETEALLDEMDAATQPAPEEECPVAGERGTDESRSEETATESEYRHSIIAILRSMPGIGTTVLATLLSEAGELISKQDYRALRCLCGVAPVTRRSGKTRTVVRRLAMHKRLNNAIYHWAMVAMQHDPISKAKYRALRARGHSHGRALRTVGDRLLGVACAMLRNGTLFDPERISRGAQA